MFNKKLIILIIILIPVLIVSLILIYNKNAFNFNPQNTNSTISSNINTKEITISVLAENLIVPWQTAYIPDGRIIFTERIGRVRIIEDNKLLENEVINLTNVVAKSGESGLLGIAVDPNFNTTKHIFIYYTYMSDSRFINKIVRYKETDRNTFDEDKVILDNIPGASNHDGGVLKFGPDGKLYVGIGERFNREVAQDINDLGGKILRLNKDGSIPNDNPFQNSFVWSYGHRNPQGITWDDKGDMYSTEHGPSGESGCCNDEVNKIEKGKNYGWPTVYGDKNNNDFKAPMIVSGDDKVWAPGNISFINQGPWEGSFIFTGLRGRSLYRFNVDKDKSITNFDELYKNNYGRLREVNQLPDGRILITTSNKDGRGSANENDDKILVIEFE